jgi:hypothetical protein
MKAKPVRLISQQWVQVPVEEATHVHLIFPLPLPPLQNRYIPIQLSGSRADTVNWSWNGDTEKPTLRPSILTQFYWGEDQVLYKCHSFVEDGIVQFLTDCSHENLGKSLELESH